jgi:hypothetical protein
MNDSFEIDWTSWQGDDPPAGFCDGVMTAIGAARTAPRDEGRLAPVRRASSGRKVALVAAAAFAVASAGAFAAVRLRTLARPVPMPNVEPERAPQGRATGIAVPAAETEGSSGSRPALAPAVRIDRELREAVRSKFERGLEGGGVERDPRTGLTIPSGAHGASSNLPREYIQARIREDFFPLARSCYESALAKSPTLRGRIVVDFMIVGDAKVGGIVDQAKINDRSDIEDPEFRTCLRESMLTMVFAPPENDGWVTVTYPFAFAPDDEDQHDR